MHSNEFLETKKKKEEKMWLYLFSELKVGRVEREYEKWGKKKCRNVIEDMGKQ